MGEILKLEDLVADADIGGVSIKDKQYPYADLSRESPYKRARLNWLWQQIVKFESLEEEPTPEIGATYEAHMDEALGLIAPGITPMLDGIDWDAKSTVLLDFFTKRRAADRKRANQLTAQIVLPTGEESSPTSPTTTAPARTRKAG